MNEVSNKTYDIEAVVAGHICLDITPTFSDIEKKTLGEIFSPGKLTQVNGAKMSTGGAVANTGVAMSVLGVKTALMGKVGDDPFGDVVLNLLNKMNISEGMCVAEGEQTSYSIVLVPPGTDRIFLHDPGANNTFASEDIDYNLVSDAKLFHMGYPPMMKKLYINGAEELIKIYKKTKELGVITSLDMCLPDPQSESGKADWDGILKRLLPNVDIFLPSIEELLFMVHKQEYNRLISVSNGRDLIDVLDLNVLQLLGRKLLDYGVKIAVIKCGKKGYYICTSEIKKLEEIGRVLSIDVDKWSGRELFEETYNVPKVVSTTGAGDTSIAGFLTAILRGMNVHDALRIACGTGSECVQTYDAISGIKPIDETLKMINAGWKKDHINIEGSYWDYDTSKMVWFSKNDKFLKV